MRALWRVPHCFGRGGHRDDDGSVGRRAPGSPPDARPPRRAAQAACDNRAWRRARTACARRSSTCTELSQSMQPSVMLCP